MTNTEIASASKIMLGSIEAQAMYVGDVLVWQKQSIQLPYDAEIEYLQSSNTQYIETGIIPDANTGIYIKAQWNSGEDNYIVGLRNASGNTRWCIGKSNYGWYWGYGNYTRGYDGNYSNYLSATTAADIVECKLNYLNDSKWYGEGSNNSQVQQTLPTLPFTPSYNIRLFGSAGVSADYTKFRGKLYFVKISQGQNVIMDLIPVRVGQVGYMYDKISGQLFGNSGSGTFTLGPDKQ